MGEVITIGIDLAKNVFQVHGVDAAGAVVVCRQLRRAQMLPFFAKQPPCLVGMEACATARWKDEAAAEKSAEASAASPRAPQAMGDAGNSEVHVLAISRAKRGRSHFIASVNARSR